MRAARCWLYLVLAALLVSPTVAKPDEEARPRRGADREEREKDREKDTDRSDRAKPGAAGDKNADEKDEKEEKDEAASDGRKPDSAQRAKLRREELTPRATRRRLLRDIRGEQRKRIRRFVRDRVIDRMRRDAVRSVRGRADGLKD